jgi:acyl carrier protein
MSPQFNTGRSHAQVVIAAAWQEVLDRPSVGLDDNFFDLGGSSVHVIHVLALLRERLNVEIAVLDLFRYPTIRSLLDALFTEEATPSLATSVQARAEKQRRAIEGIKHHNTRR